MNPLVNKWIWVLPVLLALLVNLNVLQNGFVWDDLMLHKPKSEIGQGGVLPTRSYSRPVVSWSYRMDRRLWDLNPMGYHLTSLLLHLITTLLVVRIGLRLFRDHPRRTAIAGLAGLIFAVHPVHTEAVAWVAGRNDILMTLFLLVAVLAHLWFRQGGSWSALIPFSFGTAMALLSKEAALPFLLIFPIYDFFVGSTDRPRWRRLLTASSAIVVILVAGYALFRTQSLGTPTGNIPIQAETFWEQTRMILLAAGFYGKQLIFPYPLNAFILIPPNLGILHYGYILLGIGGAFLLTGFTLRAKDPLFITGLWAMALGMAASVFISITKITHVPLAERYLYLPSVGFVYMAGFLWFQMAGGVRRRFPGTARFWNPAALSLILVVMSIATFERNQVWRNEASLWKDTILKSPEATLPHIRLGRVYVSENNLRLAQKEFRLAVEGVGRIELLASAANNLGAAYFDDEKPDRAEEAFRMALDYQEERAEPHFGLGIIYWNRAASAAERNDPSSGPLFSEAHKHLMKTILRDSRHFQAYYALAKVDLALNRHERARMNFQKVLQLNPNSRFGQEAAQFLSRTENQ